jgi:hypothetical protein
VADCITDAINIRMTDKPFTIDFDELKMHANDKVPEYRIYAALGALERIGVIEFDEENLLIRVNYNFIYGYRDSVKRRWYDEYELTATFESESMDDALEYADDIPIPLDGEYTVQEMTLVHVLEMD